MNNLLGQFLVEDSSAIGQIETPILKIRGKTLIYGNVVYQIHNIASIGLVDLTTTKPVPKWCYWLLLLGLILVFSPVPGSVRVMGVILLAVSAIWLYLHHQNKTRSRYGMTLYTNSGQRTILISRSKDFIKRVILNLYQVMNNDEVKAVTFNFKDESINIDQNIASPINKGSVHGDIVSEI